MTFVFQLCDNALSRASGTKPVVYGTELEQPQKTAETSSRKVRIHTRQRRRSFQRIRDLSSCAGREGLRGCARRRPRGVSRSPAYRTGSDSAGLRCFGKAACPHTSRARDRVGFRESDRPGTRRNSSTPRRSRTAPSASDTTVSPASTASSAASHITRRRFVLFLPQRLHRGLQVGKKTGFLSSKGRVVVVSRFSEEDAVCET